MAKSPICPLCKQWEETSCHALVDCEIAETCWLLLCQDGIRKVSKAKFFLDFIQHLSNLFSVDGFCLALILM